MMMISMTSARRRVTMVVASCLVFIVTGEILARLLDIVDRLNGYHRVLFTSAPGSAVPYRLRPNVETTFLGSPVRVNALGFRGAEISRLPRAGVRRVLLLGDSVVFGAGVGEEETLSVALQRRLSAGSGPAHEVVNGGVPGFDMTASVELLATAGFALEPEAVVLGVSLNDFDVAAVYHPLGILTRQPSRGVLDRSEFATLLLWLVDYGRGRLAFQVLDTIRPPRGDAAAAATTAIGRAVHRRHLRFYHDPDPPRWHRLRQALERLRALTEARELRTHVVIFPEEFQVIDSKPDLAPQQRLLALCGEVGLRCTDLRPAFAAAGASAGEGEGEGEGEGLFSDVQHPNARGLAVAASAVAAVLSEPVHQEPSE
jgi:hypothetical protein